MNYTLEEKEYFMRQALEEARKSLEKDEIPIGCVIVKEGQIIGRGHNAREELNQAIMHAEVMAIQEANRDEGHWNLARIPQVVYGAANQKFGAAGSLYDILTDQRLNHRVEVETGILEESCAQIMQDFFRQRREKQKADKLATKSQVDQS